MHGKRNINWKKLISGFKIPVYFQETKKKIIQNYIITSTGNHGPRGNIFNYCYRSTFFRPRHPMKERELVNKLECIRITLQWYYRQRINTNPGYIEYDSKEECLKLLSLDNQCVKILYKSYRE